MTNVLRQRAEHQFLHELDALAAQDTRTKPPQWKLSPQAVVTYLLGGKLDNGVEISAKYIGNKRLVEIGYPFSTNISNDGTANSGVPRKTIEGLFDMLQR